MSSNLKEKVVAKLVEYYHSCCRPEEKRVVGGEWEKLAFSSSGERALYSSEDGIKAILKNLEKIEGYQVSEKTTSGDPYGLDTPVGKITLEPGAQLELGGNCWQNLHPLQGEWGQHLEDLIQATNNKWLAIGLDPYSEAENIELIPKKRYHIMAKYLPQKGEKAPAMMRLTASIQVNLDFSSEEDAISMLRTGLALSPFVTAMFANSPILNNQDTGFMSYRTHIWSQTDPDRCGVFDNIIADDKFSFESYARLLVDLPFMFFIGEDDVAVEAEGKNLIQCLEERNITEASVFQIQQAIQQFFSEVRLKSFVEFRGMDTPPPELTAAVPAIWTGLMYDRVSRDKAWELTSQIPPSLRPQLWSAIARDGLGAKVGDLAIGDFAEKIYGLALEGLERRGFKNSNGEDERIYLRSLEKYITERKSPAFYTLERWKAESREDFLTEMSYKNKQNLF